MRAHYLKYFDEENTHNSFYHRIEIKLRQVESAGDPEESGLFKLVPKEEGKWVTHESMLGLLMMDQGHSWRDVEIPITENTSEIQIPNDYLSVSGYFENGRYISFRDNAGIPGTLYLTSNDTIAKEGRFTAGETIKLRIIPYPPEIINDSDIVRFPYGFYDLLALDIISMGSGFAGKEQARALDRAYVMRLQSWQQKTPKARHVGSIPRRGRRFGGRGRG